MRIGNVSNWISACLPVGSANKPEKAAGKAKTATSSKSQKGGGKLGMLRSWTKSSRSKKGKDDTVADEQGAPVLPTPIEDALDYIRGGSDWIVTAKTDNDKAGKAEGKTAGQGTSAGQAKGSQTGRVLRPNPSWSKGSFGDLAARRDARDTALRTAASAALAIPEISAAEAAAGAGEGGIRSGSAFLPRPGLQPGAEQDDVATPLVAEHHGIDAAPVRAWLAERGIETVPNSGSGMNCLLIALLQHATGRYDAESEPELAEEAETCRRFLAQQHPEIESLDRMLYADEPAIRSALQYINVRCDAHLDVHWVEPHADGHPVRWLRSSTGDEPVAIVRFGNHFEALRSSRDSVPPEADGLGGGAKFEEKTSRSTSQSEDERPPLVYTTFAQRLGMDEGSSGDLSDTVNRGLVLEMHDRSSDSERSWSFGPSSPLKGYVFDEEEGDRSDDGRSERSWSFGTSPSTEYVFDEEEGNRSDDGQSERSQSFGRRDETLIGDGGQKLSGEQEPVVDDRPADRPDGRSALSKVVKAVKDGIGVMTDPDKRYLHGFGVASTTTSTPIRSDTWTPKPKPYTGFRYDNEVALGLHFADEALPPGSGRPALRDKLMQLAQDKGLTETEATRLTQSFKTAFGTSADPAREALAALNTLLDTSFVDSIRTVGFRTPPRPAGADHAWTLAQHIVTPMPNGGGRRPLHDDIGARLIGKLALPSLTSRSMAAPRALLEQDAAMLGELTAVFLRASRAALAEADGANVRGCDAASVFALGRLGEATKGRSAGREWPGRNGTPVPKDLTRAEHALLAVKNQLTAWTDHIAAPGRADTPFVLDAAATKAMKPFATAIETSEPARVAAAARPEEPAMTHPMLEKPSRAAPREAPPEIEIVARLNADDALKNLFDEQPEMLRGTQRTALFETLSGLRRTKVETEGLTPEQAKAEEAKQANKLTGPESVDLAYALDLAFGHDFDPSARALAALQALQRTNLLDGLRQIGTPNASPPAAEGADALWHLAQEIVQIPGGVGKSLIAKLTPGPAQPRDPRTHASVADKERLVLNTFFKAAARVRQEAAASTSGNGKVAPALAHDPESIYGFGRLGDAIRGRSPQDWPGRDGTAVPKKLTIAQKALLAVRDELRALDEHAGDPARLATPFTKGTHGCRFAIPMIRNGLPTDQDRDLDGKPSEFRTIESRLTKSVGKHVERAMRNPTGWSKFRSNLRGIVSPFTKKSPFLTHNRIAEETPERGIGVVNQGGTHAARAQGNMMDTVAAAIDAQPHLKHDAVRDDEGGNAALLLLVRADIARQVKSQAFFMTRHSTPKRLLNFSKEKVIATVLDKLAPAASANAADDERENNAALRKGLRERIAPLVEQENQEVLAPHTLLRWASDAGGPGSPIAAQRLASNEAADPRWRAFSKDFLLLTEGSVAPISMESFKGKERSEVADAIATVVAAEELGSAFAFDNAGNVTVTTKGVQDTVTSLLTGFVAKLHVDLGGGLVRTVRFESSNTTDRTQLRVCVQTLKKVETGVGGSLGTGPVPLKGSIDVGYTYDVVDQEGAVLGFPRNLTGGSPGDLAASARKAELVKLLVNHATVGGAGGNYARPGNEEDRRSLIKSALHEFGDDLSIGYFEQHRSDHTGSGSIGAVLGLEGLNLDAFGHQVAGVVGGNVGGRYLSATMQYRDRSGFLRTERDTAQSMWRGAVTGAATGVLGIDAVDPDPHAAVPDPTSNVLAAATQLYSASADVWRDGVMYQSTAIVQDGEEHPTSYATHTFQSPIDFLRNTRDKLPEMAEGKSRKFFPAEFNNPDPAVRADRVALEEAYVKEFAAWAVSQRDTTATPQIYYEFDANVATSNHLRAYEYLMARSGNTAEAKRARAAIETIHTDGRYREAHFPTYPQTQQEGRTAGINGIVGVTYAASDNRTQQVLTFT